MNMSRNVFVAVNQVLLLAAITAMLQKLFYSLQEIKITCLGRYTGQCHRQSQRVSLEFNLVSRAATSSAGNNFFLASDWLVNQTKQEENHRTSFQPPSQSLRPLSSGRKPKSALSNL